MKRYVLEDDGAEPSRSFCPDGWEWDVDLGRCVQVDDGGSGTSDESFLFVSDADWSSPSTNTIEVSYALENNITSGAGETLTGTTQVLVDGSVEYRAQSTVGPGDSVPESVTIDGVSGGSHEVCIKEESESGTGICQTVTVDAPEQDESFLYVADAVWATPSRNTIEVAYSLENNIRSGDGETLTGTTQVTVDGSIEHRSQSTVSPGGSAPENVRISDVSAGEHEVCIREEGESGTGICQDVTVEGVSFDPFAFEVTSCPAPRSAHTPGESFTLDVSVRNNNSVAGSVPVVVQGRPPGASGNQDNVTLASTEATISGNSTSTVSVTVDAPSEPGDWDLIAYTTEASEA